MLLRDLGPRDLRRNPVRGTRQLLPLGRDEGPLDRFVPGEQAQHTNRALRLQDLARAPAKVIAYDVVFSEPDTRTGFAFGGSTLSGAESDKTLADSIKAAGNVILPGDASYDTETPGVTIPDAGYRHVGKCERLELA